MKGWRFKVRALGVRLEAKNLPFGHMLAIFIQIDAAWIIHQVVTPNCAVLQVVTTFV